MRQIRSVIAFSFFCILATYAAADCIETAQDIVEKIKCLPEVSKVEEPGAGHSLPGSIRHIEVRFKQPVDHNIPEGASFDQRVVILHRLESAPVILQTSGYAIFGVQQSDLTRLFKTNQIQVEHRFFADSVPSSVDWTKLNIQQSAEDFHRIFLAFKRLYPARWVNTGASKGGMTSIYHRFFHPEDLDGTVALVAPLSFTTSDQRYVRFIDEVGGDRYAECRKALKQAQVNLLTHRDVLLPQFQGNFTTLGSADVAFEHFVIETPYAFWQYGDPESTVAGCNSIPDAIDVAAQFRFFQRLNPISMYSDQELKNFQPYYFQAATQLGNPGNLTEHLEPLRKFLFEITQYIPAAGVGIPYNNQPMREVAEWTKTHANKVIFVYGEFDPWSAGAFPEGRADAEVRHFWVAGGNHGARIENLPNSEQTEAKSIVARWLGVENTTIAKINKSSNQARESESLEDLEFKMRRLKSL